MKLKGDAIQEMKKLKSKSIDLIVTDPPYGIKYADWDNLNLDFIKECTRVLKDNGSIWIFCGWSNVLKVKEELEKYFILRNWIIWDRIKGRGAKYNFTSTREDILWATKGTNYTFNKIKSNNKKNWIGSGKWGGKTELYRSLSNVWTDISPVIPWSKEYNGYPAQKPLSLIERIIKISSNEKELILDPFVGSGTTIKAAGKLNRKCIGIDLND